MFAPLLCPLYRGGVFAADHLTTVSLLFIHFPLIFTSTCLNPFRFYFCRALFWSWQGHSSLWISNHASCTCASLSRSLSSCMARGFIVWSDRSGQSLLNHWWERPVLNRRLIHSKKTMLALENMVSFNHFFPLHIQDSMDYS